MKHGHATQGISPTYHTWAGMLARCTNPKNSHWRYYGGAGITVTQRWHTFANFLADMGEKPAGTTLDRIDRERGYMKSNCRWATPTEQARNKSNNRLMTLNGVTKTQSEWCEQLGIHQATVNHRLSKGWNDADALTKEPAPPRRMLTHNGLTLSAAEWARRTGLKRGTIYQRLHRGCSDAEALST